LLGGILISQEAAEKPFFKNYILSDGAFWGITSEIIATEVKNYSQDQRLPINVILSGAQRGYYLDVADFERRLRARQYDGIKIVNNTLPYLLDEMAGHTFISFIDFLDE